VAISSADESGGGLFGSGGGGLHRSSSRLPFFFHNFLRLIGLPRTSLSFIPYRLQI